MFRSAPAPFARHRVGVSGYVAAVLFSLSATFAAADVTPDLEQVLVGMSARRDVVQTGTFHYKYGVIFADPDAPQPWPWNSKLPNEPREILITIAGTEWVIRWPHHPIINMHREKFDATFKEVMEAKEKKAGLVLEGAYETIEEESKADMKFRLLQAGTVPWGPLWDYLVEHWAKVRDLGVQVVGGETCRALEWSVPGTDFQVLQSYSADLTQREGMLLRLYVVPSKGFLLKQLDYCTPDGRMTTRFESRDLRKVAEGIWFPWGYYYIRNHRSRGLGYFVEQFTVLDIKGVNEPVAESAFEIDLPAGTTVWDERPGRRSTQFVTDGSMPLSKVDAAIQKRSTREPGRTPQKPWRMVLFVCNFVAGGALLFIALMRRRRSVPPTE